MEGDYEVNLFPQVCEIGLLAKPVGDRIFLAIDGGGIRLGKVIEFEEIFVRDESPNHEG